MTEKIKDWGCPDWRDHKSYPSNADDLEDWEWRWQFMRRWPAYRDLFFSLPRLTALDPDLEFDPDDSYRGLGRAGFSEEKIGNIRHLTNMMTVPNPALNHIADKNPFVIDKGGIKYTLPPRSYWEDMEPFESLEGAKRLEFIERRFQFLLYCLEKEGILEGAPSPLAYVRFDLTRPLPQQMKTAKSQLEKLAGKRRAPRLKGKDRDLWPIYLRVIDAKDQKAKDMEIFHHMLKEAEKNQDVALYERMMIVDQEAVLISDWKAAARRLMKTAAAFL